MGYSVFWSLLMETHITFILQPVPHNHVAIPATCSQQVILRVEGHTVQWARAEPGCYLITFAGGPHLITQNKKQKTKKQNHNRKKIKSLKNHQRKMRTPTFSVESRDTVAMCLPSAATALAVIALAWASMRAVLKWGTWRFIQNINWADNEEKKTFSLQSHPLTCSHSQCPTFLYARWKRW